MDAKSFRNRCVRAGQIAVGLCIIANFLPGIYLWLAHGIMPSFKDIIQLWLLAASAIYAVFMVDTATGLLMVLLVRQAAHLSWVVGSGCDIFGCRLLQGSKKLLM